MKWSDVYESLQRDPHCAPAWEALRTHVARWAQGDLAEREGEAVEAPDETLEEVVAHTCARVTLYFRTARGGATFGGFVRAQYVTARREALLQRSDSGLGLLPAPHPGTPPAGALGDQGAGAPYRRRDLERCLASLPDCERVAIEQYYLQHAGRDAVAAALGVSRFDALQVLWQARIRLRSYFQPPHRDE